MKMVRKLILIFCLLLFFPAHLSYGQNSQIKEDRIEGERIGSENVAEVVTEVVTEVMVDSIYYSGGSSGYGAELIAMPMMAGVILGAFLIGDLLADTCVSRFHPGDFYYEKNYKIMKTKNKEAWECYNDTKCANQVDMNVVMGVTRSGGGMGVGECRHKCIDKVIKSTPSSVAHCARKKTDGYYSDGSYYYSSSVSGLAQLFNNTHKSKDKYKKNEWQSARDECMETASKQNRGLSSQIIYDSYNECLKERGF